MVRIEHKTLTDGSKVHSVVIDEIIKIDCVDLDKARFLYDWLHDGSNVVDIENLQK
jgi:hypothetical protein